MVHHGAIKQKIDIDELQKRIEQEDENLLNNSPTS